jgi:prepilin-type N-terminal cleavage/methylation domain-containing protein
MPIRPRPPVLRRSRPAFTLIELLIVITMIAILAGFAIPRIDFVKARSDAAARLVRGQLQTAQRLAIQRQYNILVSFDVARNRIRIVEDQNNNGAAESTERILWRSLEEQARFASPPSGISVGGSAIAGSDLRTLDGMPTITFRRDGSASGNAEIYISSPRSLGKDFRGVVVTESTGRAEWFRYDGSTWKRVGI